MKRAYYSGSIRDFCRTDPPRLLGDMANEHAFTLTETQRDAWIDQAFLLSDALAEFDGVLHLEFSIPRMGRRIDAVLLIGPVIFVIEFKVGEKRFLAHDIDQVTDYALDLRNFHEGSHTAAIVPILIATRATPRAPAGFGPPPAYGLFAPVRIHPAALAATIRSALAIVRDPDIDPQRWARSGYRPTPTIIEAALALYNGHSVEEISRHDAGAINLGTTSKTVARIIRESKARHEKAICFVTGVPGAGKTLVGLNIATTFMDKADDLHSIYLSGNGPLVAILREALARDRIRRERERGITLKMGAARSEVKTFIQNVHHFRDDCLVDPRKAPIEHVAIFDEAQRAWNLKRTVDFMQRKKHIAGFDRSEPEFLISCLDRHADWAVVVCLVGGGQEINTGEAGIREWIEALDRSFPGWRVHVSNQLTDSEYGAGELVEELRHRPHVSFETNLHLAASVRSFRSEKVSLLVKQLLDLEIDDTHRTLEQIGKRYPIALTRDLDVGRRWVRERARGSERYGIVVSSQAERLKPYAVDVKSPINPVHWFLGGKDDVRSSYYLEDVATEFHVQGLELDWACVAWDADFRYAGDGWNHWSFRGNRWQRIRNEERRRYLKNAYRVLLTRARQGMVVVVPEGDVQDPTRDPRFYNDTFDYLRDVGLEVIR